MSGQGFIARMDASQVLEAAKDLVKDAKQRRFATALALNKSVQWSETAVRKAMRGAFQQPTRYFLQSLRIKRADVRAMKLQAELVFKDRGLDDSSEAMMVPHVEGGRRKWKPMEDRLQRAGILPAGWYVVPGQAADIDANGNMSRGQISQILNVLGTYREAGYNKANAKTAERLAKGNAKKGVYGFAYFVNRPQGGNPNIPPGVYKRIKTAFGSSLKPVLIFVTRVTYKKRFDFYGIAQREFDARYPGEFDRAYEYALRTAR